MAGVSPPEQAGEHRQHRSPGDGADDDDVELPVRGIGVRRDLHAAAVAPRYRGRDQQHFGLQAAEIPRRRHLRRLEAEQVAQRRKEIPRRSRQAAAPAHRLADLGIESAGGDGAEVAVAAGPEVDKDLAPLDQVAQRLTRPPRYPEGAREVVGGSARQQPESGLRAGDRRQDLVEGAVPSAHDDAAGCSCDRLAGEFAGVAAELGNQQVRGEPAFPEVLGSGARQARGAAPGSCRIGNDGPSVPLSDPFPFPCWLPRCGGTAAFQIADTTRRPIFSEFSRKEWQVARRPEDGSDRASRRLDKDKPLRAALKKQLRHPYITGQGLEPLQDLDRQQAGQESRDNSPSTPGRFPAEPSEPSEPDDQ